MKDAISKSRQELFTLDVELLEVSSLCEKSTSERADCVKVLELEESNLLSLKESTREIESRKLKVLDFILISISME